MSTELAAIVRRREALVARSRALRGDLGTDVAHIGRRLRVIDRGTAAARRLLDRPPVVGAAIAAIVVVVVVRPRVTLRWASGAAALLSLVLRTRRIARQLAPPARERAGAAGVR